ncbi:aminoglycoside phosphotransferase family protein [Actinopolymorpha alba]|uniref:aminoglycoside phosphotransferase family protein n=1 Tax=Actinopolymorpha alba TaxID=533267 RepID=UPI000380CF33|nr:aminoglycoside phosphotransferase family protein [Actinopolymorpha alba]
MADELVHAVLAPPDLRRFRELTGVGNANLDVSFAGWSKLAVLSDDRAFLFPRRGRDAALLRGARTCEILSALGVSCVPRVLGQWPDGAVSAGPFVAFERRPGASWQRVDERAGLDEVERMLASLGGVIATWHRIDVALLPPELLRGAHGATKQGWLSSFLDPDRADGAVDAVVRLLDAKPSWSAIWRATIRSLSTMTPVLVHGDVCENQLLVDAHGQVNTVLDWDTAGMGHPLHDFDFGEWGFGIFSWEPDFARLRRAMWDAYVAGRREAELPTAGEVHLLFTLAELAYFEEQNRQGMNDAWGAARLARCRAAIGPATDGVAAAGSTPGSR